MGNTRTHLCTLCALLQPRPMHVYRSLSAPHVVSDFVPEWENVWNVFFFVFLFGGEIYWRRKAYSIMYHPTTGMVCIYTTSSAIHCVSLHTVPPAPKSSFLLFALAPSLILCMGYIFRNAFHPDPLLVSHTHTHTLRRQRRKGEREKCLFL